MASRGHIRPGSIHHGSFPPGHRHSVEPIPPPELVENKLAIQAADIEQLAGDNHRLVASQLALREDLAAAQQEMQRLRAHIRSIQTEGDIQIRVLLDKIAKTEVDIRVGESVRNDLQQAHIEARDLVAARQQLSVKIEQATQKLNNARADFKNLPEMHAELDSLRQEHQRLRRTFEYEKGLNIDLVEQLRAMEQNLIGMAREAQMLRSEVLKAEKRTHAPNSYMDPTYPPPMHGGGGYTGVHGGPYAPHMDFGLAGDRNITYADGSSAAGSGATGGAD